MKEHVSVSCGLAYRASDMRAGRTTILFVHGLSGNASVWTPYEKAFEKKYNIIAPDLRGHGLSARRRHYRDYSITHFAEDLRALLEELQAEALVVVCHSLGALVVLELVRRYPALVSGIVFISPAADTRRLFAYHRRHLWRSLGAVAAFLLASLALWRRGRADYRRYRSSHDWDPWRIFDDISRMGVRPYLYSLSHLYAYQDAPRWSALRVPAMVVHGSADSMVPFATACCIARRIPRSTLVRIEGSDHMLPIVRVEQLVKAIQDFLAAIH